MSKRLLIMLAFMATLTFGWQFTARAESPSGEEKAQGIAAASFILHPGAEFGLGYDSLGGFNKGSYGDAFVNFAAFLKTELHQDSPYTWENELRFAWQQFWGLGKALAEGQPELSLKSSAELFSESFVRLMPRFNYAYQSNVEDDNLRQDFKNHTLLAGSSVYLQPGGGAIFSQRLGYHLNARLYPDQNDISYFDHRIDAMTRWSFFPQNSMALLIDFRVIHPLNSSTQSRLSLPIRLKYNLQGLILDRLSYNLGLGYSFVYYAGHSQEHLFITNAKVRYAFHDKISLGIEYRKDFEHSTYGDYYKFHRVNLFFDALWFDKLETQAEIGFSNFGFIGGSEDRKDQLFTAQAHAYYQLFPGFKLGLEYKLRLNHSNANGADYNRHFAMFKLQYEY